MVLLKYVVSLYLVLVNVKRICLNYVYKYYMIILVIFDFILVNELNGVKIK